MKNNKLLFFNLFLEKICLKFTVKNLIILLISIAFTFQVKKYAIDVINLDFNFFKDFIFLALLGSTVYKFLHSLFEAFWEVYLKQCSIIEMFGNVSLKDVFKIFSNKELRNDLLKSLVAELGKPHMLSLSSKPKEVISEEPREAAYPSSVLQDAQSNSDLIRETGNPAETARNELENRIKEKVARDKVDIIENGSLAETFLPNPKVTLAGSEATLWFNNKSIEQREKVIRYIELKMAGMKPDKELRDAYSKVYRRFYFYPLNEKTWIGKIYNIKNLEEFKELNNEDLISMRNVSLNLESKIRFLKQQDLDSSVSTLKSNFEQWVKVENATTLVQSNNDLSNSFEKDLRRWTSEDWKKYEFNISKQQRTQSWINAHKRPPITKIKDRIFYFLRDREEKKLEQEYKNITGRVKKKEN